MKQKNKRPLLIIGIFVILFLYLIYLIFSNPVSKIELLFEKVDYHINKLEFDEAQIYLNKISITSQDPLVYLKIANNYNRMRNPFKAIEFYEIILTDYADSNQSAMNNAIYSELGWSYYEIDKYDTAIIYFNKSIQNNENDESGYLGMGRFYSENSKYDQAINMYKKAKLIKNSSFMYYEYGRGLRLMGKFNQSLKLLSEGIKIYPNDRFILNELGLNYYILKDYNKAEEMFLKSIDQNGDKYTCPYEGLGMTYYKMGMDNKSKNQLNISLIMDLALAQYFYLDNSSLHVIALNELISGNLNNTVYLLEAKNIYPINKKATERFEMFGVKDE